MYSPVFRIKAFNWISDPAKFRVMEMLLEALAEANAEFLREQPHTPWLYESEVVYMAEPDGRDEWQDIPDTLERGNGDCEDLAAWRVAELRVRKGEKVAFVISVQEQRTKRGEPVTMYHIQLKRADGRVEDPSKLLGM